MSHEARAVQQAGTWSVHCPDCASITAVATIVDLGRRKRGSGGLTQQGAEALAQSHRESAGTA